MQYNTRHPNYVPTRKAIAAECARIRAGWDAREKIQRKARYDDGYVPCRAMMLTRVCRDGQDVYCETQYV